MVRRKLHHPPEQKTQGHLQDMLGSVEHFARCVEDVGDFSLQLELLVGVAPVPVASVSHD
jgi:hypothetical protein